MTKQWRGADFERRQMTHEEVDRVLTNFYTPDSLGHLREIANDPTELPWLVRKAKRLLAYYERRRCSQGDHTPTDFAVGAPCVCGAKKIGIRDTSHDADPRAATDTPLGWVPA